MTLFSKILVVIQFGLSVMVMAWAMMLFFNRIDWTEGSKDAAGEFKPGELKARRERVTNLWEGIRPADLSWRENRADVLAQETYRAADRPWYDAELKHAATGATAQNPAREPVYDKGVLALAPPNASTRTNVRPQLVPAKDALGRPLESLEANLQGELQKLAALVKEQIDLRTLIVKDTQLTEELEPAVGKGLIRRIEDEKVKIVLADEEREIILPLLFNTYAESELILQRRDMLEARIKELTAASKVASK